MPWSLVVILPELRARRCMASARPAASTRHVAGCDLVRHSDGTWKVIEDNVRIPSGISYVLENRAAMARLVPELFAGLPRAPGRPLPAAAAERAALGRARRPRARRRSCCGRPARSTRPTSSTRSSPARWASSWSRPRTLSSATTSCYMRTTARPRARPRGLPPPRRRLRRPARVPRPTRCSASPASCAPTAPAASRSPTRSAPASPTTRRSTATSRT